MGWVGYLPFYLKNIPPCLQKEERWGADCLGQQVGSGTVGAVAYYDGALAAATSTGGITGKLPGRVGDSPLVGHGVFADNER